MFVFTGGGQIPMMAAAMPTRNPVTVNYVELAKSHAAIKRTLDADDLPRIHDHAMSLGTVEVALDFAMNERSRPEVTVTVQASMTLPCQWCFEPRVRSIETRFSCQVADGEGEARRWQDTDLTAGTASPAEIVVARGQVLDIGALVEDELFLALPERVCEAVTCEHRPPVRFGASTSESGEQGTTVERSSPFDVLKDLDLTNRE